MTPVPKRLPFRTSEIPNPGSRAFCIELNDTLVEGFVVRKGQHFYAYHNRCPHTGVALNWVENVFLNYDEELIQCAMHGALFSIEDGTCLWGPCSGKALQKLALEVDSAGRIFVVAAD